jgi:acyl carrier protein
METLVEIVRTVMEEVPDSAITPETRLTDTGSWDSMRSVTLLIELEFRYAIDLSDVVLLGSMTIRELAVLAASRGAAINVGRS